VKHQAAKNEAKHGTIIGCKVKENGEMHARSIGDNIFTTMDFFESS
jgi:hypothetical protein